MRAHAPFSKFFFKFLAMLARPFCRYKIFGSEWDHDEQSKKIIIIDRLGFIELFILSLYLFFSLSSFFLSFSLNALNLKINLSLFNEKIPIPYQYHTITYQERAAGIYVVY